MAGVRDVNEMVKKAIAEHIDGKEHLQENGTFELHYTPLNTVNKSFTIPLTYPNDHQLDKDTNGYKPQNSSEKKDNQNRHHVTVNEVNNSRL